MENLDLRDTASLTQAVNDFQNTFTELEREVGKVIVGMQGVVRKNRESSYILIVFLRKERI